eukprot:COSAG02_NODE_3645_length_6430_cov_55.318907_4_plen_63_part_00
MARCCVGRGEWAKGPGHAQSMLGVPGGRVCGVGGEADFGQKVLGAEEAVEAGLAQSWQWACG